MGYTGWIGLVGRLEGLVGLGHIVLDEMGYMNPMENNKLFCYGILKRNYELDLNNYGAKFLGEAHIEGARLYGIGPRWVELNDTEGTYEDVQFRGVGLRLNEPGNIAHGELWEIPDSLWDWLDDIEQNGFVYVRKIVTVRLQDSPDLATKAVEAYVYEHCYPDFKYYYPLENGVF